MTTTLPLAGIVTMQTPAVDPLGSVAGVAEETGDPVPGWSATVPDVIQATAAPSMTLRLRGFSIRVAYRVNAPKLVTFGGVTPILAYESCPESQLAAGGGVVYYKREWDLIYLLPSAPRTLDVPANPYAGLDGQSGAGGSSGAPELKTGIPGETKQMLTGL